MMTDDYGYYTDASLIQKTVLLLCKDLETAARLQALMPNHVTTTYPGMPLQEHQMFDIGILGYDPFDDEGQRYFYDVFREHLKKDGQGRYDIIWMTL